MKFRIIKSAIIVVLLPVLLLSACYAGGHVRSYHFQKGIVPAGIKLRGFFSYWSATDGPGWKSCGAAVFRLSDETLMAIEQKGLAFFDGMTTSRNGERYLGQWHIVDRSGLFKGGWVGGPIGLDCAYKNSILFPFSYYDEIRSSLRNSRSYASSGRRGSFIVIPEKGLLVFSHRD